MVQWTFFIRILFLSIGRAELTICAVESCAKDFLCPSLAIAILCNCPQLYKLCVMNTLMGSHRKGAGRHSQYISPSLYQLIVQCRHLPLSARSISLDSTFKQRKTKRLHIGLLWILWTIMSVFSLTFFRFSATMEKILMNFCLTLMLVPNTYSAKIFVSVCSAYADIDFFTLRSATEVF